MMNSKIQTFITMLCEEFSLQKNDVMSVWNRVEESEVSSDSKETAEGKSEESYTEADLQKLTVTNLKAILNSQKKRVSGRKAELIARILGVDSSTVTTPARKKLTSKTSKKARDTTTLGRIYEANRPKVTVRPNNFGNHEHPETGLVFRGTPPMVYGKQNPDGTVDPLTVESIATCNQYAFPYEPPVDLAAASQAEDVAVTVDAEIADVEAAIREEVGVDSEEEFEDDGGVF